MNEGKIFFQGVTPTLETSSFEEFVEGVKKGGIHNLRGLGVLDTDDADVQAYFSENSINLDTLEDFIRKFLSNDFKGQEDRVIEGSITLLEKGEGFEKVIAEIEKKGPFTSPEALIQAISDHIKENMSYDAYSALFQIFQMGNSIDSENIDDVLQAMQIGINKEDQATIDTIVKNGGDVRYAFYELAIDKILGNECTALNLYHLQVLADILFVFRGEGINNLPEEFQGVVGHLIELVDRGDIEGLNTYLREEIANDPQRIDAVKAMLYETQGKMLSSGSTNTITGRLNDEKVGVCRHFSVIAKHIYNEMVAKGNPSIQFQGESEVLYVLNDKMMHAYNIVMYEDENGNVRKKYFDITKYMMTGKLFFESDDPQYLRDYEIFAKNDMNQASQKI